MVFYNMLSITCRQSKIGHTNLIYINQHVYYTGTVAQGMSIVLPYLLNRKYTFKYLTFCLDQYLVDYIIWFYLVYYKTVSTTFLVAGYRVMQLDTLQWLILLDFKTDPCRF